MFPDGGDKRQWMYGSVCGHQGVHGATLAAQGGGLLQVRSTAAHVEEVEEGGDGCAPGALRGADRSLDGQYGAARRLGDITSPPYPLVLPGRFPTPGFPRKVAL